MKRAQCSKWFVISALVLALAAMVAGADEMIVEVDDSGYGSAIQEDSTEISIEKAELETLIEAAVAKRIRPLQRELAQMRESIRLHDILGGIGYIIGIAGVTFYFLGVRRKEKLQSRSVEDNAEPRH